MYGSNRGAKYAASADGTEAAPSPNACVALDMLGDASPAVDMPAGRDGGLLDIVHAQRTLPLQTKRSCCWLNVRG